jgi:hypothetical protein
MPGPTKEFWEQRFADFDQIAPLQPSLLALYARAARRARPTHLDLKLGRNPKESHRVCDFFR